MSMSEYEKEKYTLLEQIELIKERICTANYKTAYWEIVLLKDMLQKAIEIKIKAPFPFKKEHDN